MRAVRSFELPPAIVDAPASPAGAPRPAGRRLYGHGAVFNVWRESWDPYIATVVGLTTRNALGWEIPILPYRERVAQGAFARTLIEDRAHIRSMLNHGSDALFGARSLGQIVDLREDEIGLRYEVELLDTPLIQNELVPGLEAGLYGASFRFELIDWKMTKRPRATEQNRDRLPEVVLTGIRLYEVGPVWRGAYVEATAQLA